MAVSNSTTINAEISGSGIDVSSSVYLRTSSSERFRADNNTARFKRRLQGGGWSYVGGIFSINPIDADQIIISATLSIRDTSLSNQNTYEYILEMEVFTEAVIPQ